MGLSGLTPNTTYHFRAKAVGDGAGYGTDQQFATTPGGTTPPAVATNAASGVSDSAATLNGNLSSLGSAPTVNVSFEWGLTTAYGYSTTPETKTSSGPFSSGISGLSPSTGYHFRAKAVGDGVTVGQDQYFTTSPPDTIPPAPVVNQQTQSPAENSITLTWTAPGDDGGSGTAFQYDVRYSTSAIDEGNWSSATEATGEPMPQAAGSDETFVVSDLSPETTYYFALKTADDALNWSPISNCPNGTTLPDTIAPLAVTDLSAHSPTPTSCTLTWTAPGNDGVSGTAAQYDIRYSTSAINEGNWASATQADSEPTPLLGGSAQSFVVTDLSPSTTYYFALKTADEAPNWSGISNCPDGTTSLPEPPSVTTNPASSVYASSAWLSGTLTSPGSASNVHVCFEYGTTTQYGWTTTGSDMTSTGDFYEGLQGLSPSTTYHFRAKADGGSAGVSYGEDQQFTTLAQGAPGVTTSQSSDIGVTVAVLNATLDSLGSAPSASVSFEYGLTTSYGSTTSAGNMYGTGSFSRNLTGLAAGTTYHFRAKAVGDGTGYGGDQQFTTLSGSSVEIIKSIAAGPDDGYSEGGVFPDFEDNASYYEIGYMMLTHSDAWFRFTGVTIPEDAVIESAHLELRQEQWQSGTSARISAEDANNPTAPESRSDHAARVRTSAGVDWTSGYSDDEWHNTPDFAPVIQELADSYNHNGSAMQIFADNNGSWIASAQGSTYEDGYAPRLYIRYHVVPDTTPPSAVSDLAADTPTLDSLRLTWTAPGDNGITGTAAQYDVRYSTSPINEGNWASAAQATGEPTPLVAGSDQTFVVSGLSPATTYYFALKTADEIPNWSGISNFPSGTTASPPASVTRVPTSDVSNTGGFTSSPLWSKVDETTPVDSDYVTGTYGSGGRCHIRIQCLLHSCGLHDYERNGLLPGQGCAAAPTTTAERQGRWHPR